MNTPMGPDYVKGKQCEGRPTLRSLLVSALGLCDDAAEVRPSEDNQAAASAVLLGEPIHSVLKAAEPGIKTIGGAPEFDDMAGQKCKGEYPQEPRGGTALKIPITELRFFMDGTEGSLCPVEIRDELQLRHLTSWDFRSTPRNFPRSSRELYVNAAQLVAWLKANGIEITCP